MYRSPASPFLRGGLPYTKRHNATMKRQCFVLYWYHRLAMELFELNTKTTIQGVHGKMAIKWLLLYCVVQETTPCGEGKGKGVIDSLAQSNIKLLWDGRVWIFSGTTHHQILPVFCKQIQGNLEENQALFSSHSSRLFLLAPVQCLTISNLWPTICTEFSQISV